MEGLRAGARYRRFGLHNGSNCPHETTTEGDARETRPDSAFPGEVLTGPRGNRGRRLGTEVQFGPGARENVSAKRCNAPVPMKPLVDREGPQTGLAEIVGVSIQLIPAAEHSDVLSRLSAWWFVDGSCVPGLVLKAWGEEGGIRVRFESVGAGRRRESGDGEVWRTTHEASLALAARSTQWQEAAAAVTWDAASSAMETREGAAR
ncbi:hypothetical protein B0T25DRAFT_211158 [Lasiosphaeria hispida]|uniref:Uncharacterized protein n=1 Tax=Lasiosphaeria hispida TaxID=260671 RepID=A0AAJ0HJD2_9PEZI|nr:hypothetical protein B0T25DRAFT_211158 [Lasiosphaeria hispida]